MRELVLIHDSSQKISSCSLSIRNFYQWAGTATQYKVSLAAERLMAGLTGADRNQLWLQHTGIFFDAAYTDLFNKPRTQTGKILAGLAMGPPGGVAGAEAEILLGNASDGARVLFAGIGNRPLSQSCVRILTKLDKLPGVSHAQGYAYDGPGELKASTELFQSEPAYYVLKDPDVPDRDDSPLDNIVIVPNL